MSWNKFHSIHLIVWLGLIGLYAAIKSQNPSFGGSIEVFQLCWSYLGMAAWAIGWALFAIAIICLILALIARWGTNYWQVFSKNTFSNFLHCAISAIALYSLFIFEYKVFWTDCK